MWTPMAAPAWRGGPDFAPLAGPFDGPKLAPDAPLALVIEDDESAADIAATMLNVLGYRTRIAEDGHAALYALAEQAPDLILLDIHLPNMDGVTLLRVARRVEETRYTPVVGCSAVYPPSGQVAKVLKELGAERYLSKPFNLAGLREAVVACHPNSPAAEAPKIARSEPAPAPTPMFRVDEVVAKTWFAGAEGPASVEAVSERVVTLRYTGAAPKLGDSVRLEITHRAAVNDAMQEFVVRGLGDVSRISADGRAKRVELSLRASSPEGGLERLAKHL